MLERLSEVQSKDLALDALDAERADVPTELVTARKELEDLDAALATRTAERDELRGRVRAAERELEGLTARKKEASAASLRASTPKEAAQYQNQELQFATRQQELEEDTIPLMEELERLNGVVEELETKRAALAPELESMEADETERQRKIDEKEGTLRETREALAGEVPNDLLAQYEQVRRARRGVGLAEIVGERRCGGCNVQLPIYVVQKARKGRATVRCPSCGRILWAKQAA